MAERVGNDSPFGWFTIQIGDEIHEVPDIDIRPHEMDDECWCKPDVLDGETGPIIIHRVFPTLLN